MTRAPQHLIFDLDGTLVDSAPVIIAILNEMLVERQSERRISVDVARPWLSLGGEALISKALGAQGVDVARELADFRSRYAARRTPAECVFDGVPGGLHALASLGFTLAICSNKPQHLCEKVLGDVGLAHYFSVIVGSSPDLRQKPAPDLMNLALRKLQARPSHSFLIGDSDVDRDAALACGVAFRFMRYGYAPHGWDSTDLVQFDHFSDLVASFRPERVSAIPLRKAA